MDVTLEKCWFAHLVGLDFGSVYKKNNINQQQKKHPKLHTPASSFSVLEDLARKEIVGFWLPAEYTGTFDPWLSAILQKRKEWGLAKKAAEILAGSVLTPILVPVRMD